MKRHRSPLHLLFTATNVKQKPYETILSARRCCNYNTLANITIEEDRLVAIETAHNTPCTVIYTDSSGYKHGIAAAVLVKNDTVMGTLKYCLGHDIIHTVYEVEALAVSLALHMASKLKKKMGKITIGMDNQAVLMGLRNQRSKPGHHLMDRIHDLLEDLQVMLKRN